MAQVINKSSKYLSPDELLIRRIIIDEENSVDETTRGRALQACRLVEGEITHALGDSRIILIQRFLNYAHDMDDLYKAWEPFKQSMPEVFQGE
ncbi:hypothetical protein EYZ11_013254 [Aspergillus tanneri]|uniref:Uncharacterized protein n=1 Tax=Aspergillus tanneri TaxID=1220188 RepID=A0A4S3IY48_9EURO|nr:hypothetical protein EYZ11_013254 [Aspergillus tanneri]